MGRKIKIDVTRFRFILKGLVVGILAGIVVSLFRLFVEKLLLFSTYIYQQVNHSYWLIFPITLVFLMGCLFIGKLIKDEPNIKGSGIPQVEGQLGGELEIDWWRVLWRKWIGGILAIGSGLFLGREGPSIQLGATVGQGFAEKTNHSGTGQRVLIAGGAAAGLSAAFNAPIASTLFVLEEVYHNFSPLVWTTALASALASNMISLSIFGLKPVLYLKYTHALPLKYYPYLFILGLILGGLGVLYQQLTLNSGKIYKKIKFIPKNYYSALPLVLLIPIGMYFPKYLGGGNGLIVSFGHYMPSFLALVGIFVLRLLFSTLSYGSGLPGGIFLPILTLGASIGACFGVLISNLKLIPGYLVVNFIIYAMAGYFACIGKAPFTAILLITEMVGSLIHLMPLAVVSLIAYSVVDLLRGRPIYEAMLDNLRKKPLQKHGTYQDRIEFPVFANSYLQDRQVRDINWPKDSLLVAIRRGENEKIPHGDTVIRSGDTLVFVTDHENIAWLKQRINFLADGSKLK